MLTGKNWSYLPNDKIDSFCIVGAAEDAKKKFR